MRISDWSSDVCSSDLSCARARPFDDQGPERPTPAPATQPRPNARPARPRGHSRGPGRDRQGPEIGRASCRESVSVRVDLGGRRILKKKKPNHIRPILYTPTTASTYLNT